MTDSREPSPSGQEILRDLHSQTGVNGTCLQMGAEVLFHDLPYSDQKAAELAGCIDRLFESYRLVDRIIWQVFFGFESHWVLVLTRGEIRLTMLLKPDTDPACLASRATRLLVELELVFEPTPSDEKVVPTIDGEVPRERFDDVLVGLLARVTGGAQAGKLIQRQFASEVSGTNGVLSPADARRIGLAILDTIPNRSKRAALAAEFLSTLKL